MPSQSDPIDLPLASSSSNIKSFPDIATTPIEPKVIWRSFNIRAGMNLTTIFQELKIPLKTLYEIINIGKTTKPLSNLKPNTTIEYSIDNEGTLLQMDYSISPKKKITVLLEDGKYIAKIIKTQVEQRIHYATALISSNVTNAGVNAGIPRKIIADMASILSWNINFKKDVRQGDSFTVIYDDHFVGDTKVRDGSILALRFHNKGKLHEVVRHNLPNGSYEYYKPDGGSLRQAFLRVPVKYTRISDKFNLKRLHPILKIVKRHTGVDYAAPTGTPIKSAGDGVISHIGRKGGYGKTVIIRHDHKYTTMYAHMSKYARHLKRGLKVAKGQVIGYVGKTGLADGPHLHYEFWVKGKKVDPEKVKLPMTKPLTGQAKKQFIAMSKPLLTQLALYEDANKNAAFA